MWTPRWTGAKIYMCLSNWWHYQPCRQEVNKKAMFIIFKLKKYSLLIYIHLKRIYTSNYQDKAIVESTLSSFQSFRRPCRAISLCDKLINYMLLDLITKTKNNGHRFLNTMPFLITF